MNTKKTEKRAPHTLTKILLASLRLGRLILLVFFVVTASKAMEYVKDQVKDRQSVQSTCSEAIPDLLQQATNETTQQIEDQFGHQELYPVRTYKQAIIVLEDGKVIEKGSHQEINEQKGTNARARKKQIKR